MSQPGDAGGEPVYVPSRTNRSLMILVVVLIAWVIYEKVNTRSLVGALAEPRPVVPRGDLAADEQTTVEIFKRAAPAVVYIRNIALVRDFWTRNVFKRPRVSGTGFIYSRAGYIVTNYHVVQGATELIVTLSDQSDWRAEIVGVAPDKDLAVLKIDAPPENLSVVPIGSSGDLRVGQKVFAIGNPFGLDHTLTTGVVSALGREINSMVDGRTIEDVIQTDAAINPGNSGGPLLDSAGRLIGVNTQIASPSGASAGIGFAIPVDTVGRVVPQIIEYGKVIRPGLGVTLVPDEIARRLHVDGVIVNQIRDGSAAAQAGLRPTLVTRDLRIRQLGDVITKVGDRPVGTGNELLNALDEYEIGQQVTITYQRDGKTDTTVVTLQALD